MPDDEHRAARRRIAKEHHPDVGGDPDAFTEAMARLDRSGPPAPPTARRPSGPVEIVVTPRGRAFRLVRRAAPVFARLTRRRYGRL